MQQLLMLDEAGAVLRLPEVEVLALIERGELGAIRLPSGEYRVPPTDLRTFLRVHRLDFCPSGEAA